MFCVAYLDIAGNSLKFGLQCSWSCKSKTCSQVFPFVKAFFIWDCQEQKVYWKRLAQRLVSASARAVLWELWRSVPGGV